jgi:hypothetical protein
MRTCAKGGGVKRKRDIRPRQKSTLLHRKEILDSGKEGNEVQEERGQLALNPTPYTPKPQTPNPKP